MVRLAAVFALVVGMLGSRSAGAATLFFEAVPTTTSTCPAPCYEIRMFYEDASRALPLQALRFDVAIAGASVPALPVPPETNLNSGGGNAFEGNAFAVQPWNLSSAVGGSLDRDYHVRIVDEADAPLTVDGVAALFADGCAGASCAAIRAGLGTNRLYLGRFNVTWNGGLVTIQAGVITGEGAGVLDPVEGLTRLSNAVFGIHGFPRAVEIRAGAVLRPRRRSQPDRVEPQLLRRHAPVRDPMHAVDTVERAVASAPDDRANLMDVDSLRLNVPGLHVGQAATEPLGSPPGAFCGPGAQGCTTTEYEFGVKPAYLKDDVSQFAASHTNCGLHGQPNPLAGHVSLREQTDCKPTSWGPMCSSDIVPVGTMCHLPRLSLKESCTAAGIPLPCCTGAGTGGCIGFQPRASNTLECGIGGTCMVQPGVGCPVAALSYGGCRVARLSHFGMPLVDGTTEVPLFSLDFNVPEANSGTFSLGEQAGNTGRGAPGGTNAVLDDAVRCKSETGTRYVLPASLGGDGTKTYIRWDSGGEGSVDVDWLFAAGQGSVFYTDRTYGRPAYCSRYPPPGP